MTGIVAIGRNEGERLRACLASARRDCAAVVYVDSGSTDGSAALAQSLGVHVVDLDLSKPFTAARARNEGFAKLLEIEPNIDAVQFIDGDCEIVDGWIAKAEAELSSNPNIAVVCGRRRERFPRASIYNTLCDMEWNTPIGTAKSCGGDALIRVKAFQQVNGYNPEVIAGEEPEMCVRLRQLGWTIHRIDAEMTLHDAAMTEFSQWWKRSLRSGHAYAQGNALHGIGIGWDAKKKSYEILVPFRLGEVKSIENWSTGPLVLVFGGVALLLLSGARYWCFLGILPVLLYPLLAVKVALNRRARRLTGESFADAMLYGTFVVLGKFPQRLGVRRFQAAQRRGEKIALIEYKGPAEPHAGNPNA